MTSEKVLNNKFRHSGKSRSRFTTAKLFIQFLVGGKTLDPGFRRDDDVER